MNITTLVENHAINQPDKVAFIYEDKKYLYKNIMEQVEKLATQLQHNLSASDKVAMILPNCPEIIQVYLACFKTSNLIVSLNYKFKAPEIELALKDIQARWLITNADILGEIDSIDLHSTGIEKVFAVGMSDFNKSKRFFKFEDLINHNLPFNFVNICVHSPALIFYTSGTTGKPKGVVHTNATAKGMLETALFSINADTIFLVSEAIMSSGGFIDAMSVLISGGTAIVLREPNLKHYMEAIDKYHPTNLQTRTSRYVDIIQHLKFNKFNKYSPGDFINIKLCGAGGDKLPFSVQKEFYQLTNKIIHADYGMTESGLITLNTSPEFSTCDSIGKPVKYVNIKLVDHNGITVKNGEVGEVIIKSPANMIGYWNNKEETQNAFINGWLKSGDLAQCDSMGFYWFKGRIKHIIVTDGGKKVSPQEVEAVIYQHPAIKLVGVVGIKKYKHGQVIGELPVAFITTNHDVQDAPTEHSLLQFISQKIAAYKIPVKFYYIKDMPITSSGKVDRIALAKML